MLSCLAYGVPTNRLCAERPRLNEQSLYSCVFIDILADLLVARFFMVAQLDPKYAIQLVNLAPDLQSLPLTTDSNRGRWG